MIYLDAVSYTHLDVYKRQFLQFFGISGKINSILQINSPDCAACSGRSEGIFREQ